MTPAEQVEGIAKGTIYMIRWGKDVPIKDTKLNKKEALEFESAKARGYIHVYDKRYNLPNIWFRWCEEVTQHPYVIIFHSGRRTTVEMDLIGNERSRLSFSAQEWLNQQYRDKLGVDINRHYRRVCFGCFNQVKNVNAESAEIIAQLMIAAYQRDADKNDEFLRNEAWPPYWTDALERAQPWPDSVKP